MEPTSQQKERPSLFTFKNFIIFMLVLSFAPAVLKTIQKYMDAAVNPRTHVGCLTIGGIISDSDFYVKTLEKFMKNKHIKGLLVRIKSPGGLPGAAQTIFQELVRFREKKPVVVLIEEIGTSAGYWAAIAGNVIVANKSALVANIGVRLAIGNIKEFLTYHKIDVGELSSGKFKTATSFLKPKSTEELTYLQDISDDVYNQFVSDVAAMRNLQVDQKDVWANGKAFTGNQAHALHLVDRLGSIYEAKEELGKLIVDRGETLEGPLKLVYPERPFRLSNLFFGESEQGGSDEQALSAHIARFLTSTYQHVRAHQEEHTLEMN